MQGFMGCAGIAAGCLLGLSAGADQAILLSPGSGQVIQAETEKIMLADPRIADARRLGSGEVWVSGKALGDTTLSAWLPGGRTRVWHITVAAGKSGPVMIQVDVQVMEIMHSRDLDVGLDWEKLTGPAGFLLLKESSAPLQALGMLERGKLDLALKTLLETGEAKILARPKLLVLSGHSASFSAGGEIPVSTTTATGATNVEWKKYGVNLEIMAKAEGSGPVEAEIRAEVSDADFTRLVQGNPAIKTRWAATTIQVENQGTVVVGGLIQNKNQIREAGVPLLGEIPLIGYLFRSTRMVSEESELVIFVTPRVLGR